MLFFNKIFTFLSHFLSFQTIFLSQNPPPPTPPHKKKKKKKLRSKRESRSGMRSTQRRRWRGTDLCLAVTTSFRQRRWDSPRFNLSLSLSSLSLQALSLSLSFSCVWFSIHETWFEGMGWFERGMGRRRWVSEDEDKGWVGGVACVRRRGHVSRVGSGHHR